MSKLISLKQNLFIMAITTLFLSGCGGSSDGGPGDVSGLPFLSVGSNTVVTSTNQSNFKLSGECRGVEKVKVTGALLFEVDCNGTSWEKDLDLTYLSNGIYKVKVVAGDQEVELELKKNTLDGEVVAFYNFSEANNLGADRAGNYDAIQVTDVISVNDSERGLVAEFNGSSSVMTLSNGTFFNEEFTQKSFVFYFKTGDLATSQVIFDEGGSTNGIGLRLENSSLILATRAGGSGTQTEVTSDLTGLENTWVKVIASFDKGTLGLSVNGIKTENSAVYSTIPSHGDSGGLGDEIGSSVFSGQTVNPFQGFISDFRVFNKSLSEDELTFLAGENPLAKEVSSLELGKVISYSFSDNSQLGKNDVEGNPSGNAQNVTQAIDTTYGNVANFNGSDAFIKVSNGVFWNKAFSVKSYAFYFKASDLLSEQVLFEEGGSTNGISLRIENGYLFADAKAGNSAPQQTLIEDIIDMENEWVKVVIQFNSGVFKMSVGGKGTIVTRNATFTSIPDHSSDGAIARRMGGDASGNSGDAFFSGMIHKFTTYSRPLSDAEVNEF